jgi:dCMP deaminase
MDHQRKWDLRFLRLAKEIATWSKDPSTQVGSLIVDQDRRIVSTGYNGFCKGVGDDPERYANRDEKYPRIIHGELNALLFANRDLQGCTLYTWPFMSCSRCAGPVIQKGITRCVAPETPPDQASRWGTDTLLAVEMFAEAGVTLVLYPLAQVLERELAVLEQHFQPVLVPLPGEDSFTDLLGDSHATLAAGP